MWRDSVLARESLCAMKLARAAPSAARTTRALPVTLTTLSLKLPAITVSMSLVNPGDRLLVRPLTAAAWEPQDPIPLLGSMMALVRLLLAQIDAKSSSIPSLGVRHEPFHRALFVWAVKQLEILMVRN